MHDSRTPNYGMTPLQMLYEPLNNLRLLGRRTLLALLGIAMGCAAVVALLNIGYNAQNEAISVFRGMGSNLLVASVQPHIGRHKARPSLPAELDIAALRQELPGIQAAAALIPSSTSARVHGRTINTIVIGSGAELPAVMSMTLAKAAF